MGQICSGQKSEASKESAISGDVTAEDLALLKQQQQQQPSHHFAENHHEDTSAAIQNQNSASQQQSGVATTTKGSAVSAVTTAEDRERLKALQQEQQRLDMIVAAAGRAMISVRSTRGSTGYYDQGFAAALAQHLEQTTSFPSSLPVTLPAAPSEEIASDSQKGAATGGDANPTNKDSNSVYARLSKPQWEGIVLGTSGTGVAGCGGENPVLFMDNVAESLLDTALPAKQHLFTGVKSIVENLL
jgi:hypothetical protein